MPINKNELTKEQIAKAMSCETAEELMVLAKTEGIELTKEEAEAYLIELSGCGTGQRCTEKCGGWWHMLYCLLKEDRVLVFKKAEVFYNGKNQHE